MKQIFFDIGNVIVYWQPEKAFNTVLPDHDPTWVFQKMHPTWIELNLGKLTIEEAIDIYHVDLKISKNNIRKLFQELMHNQTTIHGMSTLLASLSDQNIPMYAVTDNIREFLEFHQNHSSFLNHFIDMAVSADIGQLKPHADMYQHLLNKYHLNPRETLFFDDIEANVEGAKQIGLQAYQFEDALQCQTILAKHGLLPNTK